VDSTGEDALGPIRGVTHVAKIRANIKKIFTPAVGSFFRSTKGTFKDGYDSKEVTQEGTGRGKEYFGGKAICSAKEGNES